MPDDRTLLPASSSGDSDPFPDAGPHLRSAFHISPGAPVDLSVIPDPPPGERPAAQLESLVQLAIYASPRGKLTLQEIYSAIEDRFEYYRTTNARWKASIRHMLSLKSIFVSTPRPPSVPGRGNYWQLDPGVTARYKRPRKRRSTSGGRSGSSRRAHPSHSFTYDSSSSGWDDSDDNKSIFEQMFPLPKTEADATSYEFCQEMKSALAAASTPTPTATPPPLRFSPSPPPSMMSPFMPPVDLNLPPPSTSYFSDTSLYPNAGGGLGTKFFHQSQSLAPPLVDPCSEMWWGRMLLPGPTPNGPNLDLNQSYSPPLPDHSLGLPKALHSPRTIRSPLPPSYYTQ